MHKKTMTTFWTLALGLLTAAGLSQTGTAHAQDEEIKIGFAMFLSGAAAGPFGVPARNGAELVVEALNKGEFPAPYDGKKGINGAKITTVFVDEASGEVVADYRKMVQKDEVDLVIGYISSGNCKAIAPVAEEVERLTLFFDCGTPQVFEDVVTDPHYLFRTGAHATLDSVGAARYLLADKPDTGSIAGINQNYAWGQDSWRDFTAAVEALKPGVEITTEQFPKIFAGQYGSEISALLTNPADAVHSSFWGGDLEAFVLQGAARGLFARTDVILTTGESAMHRLANQMPEGTVIGARGPHGVFAPEGPMKAWLEKAYMDRYGVRATYPTYKITQAILAAKSAIEMAAGDSMGMPDQESVIDALEGLEWETPSGTVRMGIANGHQAVQGTAYGRFKYSNGEATVVDMTRFDAECVMPPDGMDGLEWIESGFKGAEDC
ncbi:ABC transporter substrate-binding protein [Ectothiorhodospiraceae bacterium WFHF3C12]|nr:ABC transporter substrate-binding protein [Ectothiorhodospiraceae bacterium WFHF3C12]